MGIVKKNSGDACETFCMTFDFTHLTHTKIGTWKGRPIELWHAMGLGDQLEREMLSFRG